MALSLPRWMWVVSHPERACMARSPLHLSPSLATVLFIESILPSRSHFSICTSAVTLHFHTQYTKSTRHQFHHWQFGLLLHHFLLPLACSWPMWYQPHHEWPLHPLCSSYGYRIVRTNGSQTSRSMEGLVCLWNSSKRKNSITFKDRLLVYGWVVKDGTVMRMKQTVLVMRKMTPIRLKIISNDTGCITDFLLIICSIFFYENEVINYNKSIIMWLDI